jgi:hypothetical protein
VVERLQALRPGTRYTGQLCEDADADGSARCTAVDGGTEFRTLLRHAPPPLNDPVTINLEDYPLYCESESWRTQNLDVTRDYRIRLPRSAPVQCPLWITGGHNVVLQGGAVQIDRPITSQSKDDQHAGMFLGRGQNDPGAGTKFIEGVKISGEGLASGIRIDERAGNRVVLQNIRIEDIKSASGRFPAGDPQSRMHADCLQTWGGPEVLLVAGLTCRTDYFGLHLQPVQYQTDEAAWPDLYSFSHVNLRGYSRNGWPWRYMFSRLRDPSHHDWWPMTFDEVYSDRGAGGAGTFEAGTCHSDWVEGCAGWPSFSFGQPPDGDFVPSAQAGLGYASPGS